ncbi:MAG: hypothetical protein LQ350_006743 [Teloschistes chrysophthalmus]|nr:MAG: hypothetical protein LQ350_006743 [Niorma chrysophthalma]
MNTTPDVDENPLVDFVEESDKCREIVKLINNAQERAAKVPHLKGAQELSKGFELRAKKFAKWDREMEPMRLAYMLVKQFANEDSETDKPRKIHCVRETRHRVVWANLT